MVVIVRSGSLRLIRQLDHSLACGRMALAWVGTGPRPEPLPPGIAAGIGLHDLAWGTTDVEPVLEADTGRPMSFLTIPDDVRARMFRAGLDRQERIDETATILASLHYSRFLALHADAAFVAHEEARRRRLLARQPADRDENRWLRLADLLRHLDDLSLYVCLATPDGCERPDWLTDERVGTGPDGRTGRLGWTDSRTLELDPFPFRDPLALEIPCRDLPREPYASADALRDAWYAAVPSAHRVALVPPA